MLSTCILLLGIVKAYAEMEGFIVGGKLAQIEQQPHSAFLTVNCASYGKTETWICGSSIVNQQILLSAAHCLHGCTYESNIGVSLGNEIWTSGLSYTVYSFVIHENYSTKTSANDISLLKVSRKLRLDNRVSRVAIMKSPPYTEVANVAGWGMTDEFRESFTTQLKVISQTVWNKNRCLQIFRYLVTGTICAANTDKNEYVSQGDSGCGLIVRGYIQIGLVSYKIPTIARNVVVYTDVGYYYDWIRTYAKKLACV